MTLGPAISSCRESEQFLGPRYIIRQTAPAWPQERPQPGVVGPRWPPEHLGVVKQPLCLVKSVRAPAELVQVRLPCSELLQEFWYLVFLMKEFLILCCLCFIEFIQFKFSFAPKNEWKYFCISALGYKKRSNQKSSVSKRVKIKSSN